MRVRNQHQLLTFLPAFQHKRAGSCGVLRQKTARVIRRMRFQHGRVDDRCAVIRQRIKERGERLAERKFYRVCINGFHFEILGKRFRGAPG